MESFWNLFNKCLRYTLTKLLKHIYFTCFDWKILHQSSNHQSVNWYKIITPHFFLPWFTFMLVIRIVHGSVQVRFMPNSCSTRMHLVEKILTRNRPEWSFKSAGLGLIGFGCISVGFRFVIVDQNLLGFWPKSNLVKSNEIWPTFPPNL